MFQQQNSQIQNQNQNVDLQASDFQVPNAPSDTVSSMSVNGSGNALSTILFVGSWDNAVSCYELQYAGDKVANVIPQSQIKHDAPVLTVEAAIDGFSVFSGGADGVIKMWNPTQGPAAQNNIGQHDLPVSSVKYLSDINALVSASWDKTVKLWDTRQPNAMATIALSDRAFCMDAKDNVVVVATGDRKINVFDMRSNGNKVADYESPLAYQTKSLKIFNNSQGFAMGSIEGRVAIEYFNEMHKRTPGNTNINAQGSQSFAFKCHREKNNDNSSHIYSVNAISFSPYNTFATAGGDGCVCYWDKDSRQRIKDFNRFKKRGCVTSAIFNPMGNLMIYSIGYDWSKGMDQTMISVGTNIYVHMNTPADIQPMPKKTK